MQPFTLTRPDSLAQAASQGVGAEFIGGGTDMVQLMKEYVRRPSRLVDLTAALGDRIEVSGAGARIEAGASMERLATDPGMLEHFPAAAQAMQEAASVQVRNLATVGGTLLQRTRCGYFRDAGVSRCNKRAPGSGCAARHGENRMLAVLGTSSACIATQPSDLAVALVALRGELVLTGEQGERRLPVEALHRLPENRPDLETNLRPGEIITAIEIPAAPEARRSIYLKVRDRAAFEWSLLSAAVALHVEDGTIRAAGVAMGGIGTTPWRFPGVEAALLGRPAAVASYRDVVRGMMAGAEGCGQNDFKIEAAPRVLARALEMAGGGA